MRNRQRCYEWLDSDTLNLQSTTGSGDGLQLSELRGGFVVGQKRYFDAKSVSKLLLSTCCWCVEVMPCVDT